MGKPAKLTATQKARNRLQTDLVYAIEKVQGVRTLEEYQRRVIAKVDAALAGKGKRRIAISACHDVGKTWTMAKVVLAIGSAFPGAKIITTAPSWHSVANLLWSEIRSGYRQSAHALGGRMMTVRWELRDDWFATGLSPKDDANGGDGQGTSSSFQGYHGDPTVLIFDEATGVPPKRWIQGEGMMTSANVVFIAIGNPTSQSSPFYKCFTSASWEKVYLSCFDSPNLRAAGITDMEKLRDEYDLLRALTENERSARILAYPVVQEKLLTAQWVMEKALDWGLEHPLFVSKVLGKFPEESDDVLMPLGRVEAAQLREYTPKPEDKFAIGVDVARKGSDKTVITVIHGVKVIARRRLIKKDNMEVAGEVVAMMREIGSRNLCVAIDATGTGSGVFDSLNQTVRQEIEFRGVEIREVNFGSKFHHESDAEREESEKLYLNRKAKLFARLAADLGKTLCLPEDEVYLEELPTILYTFDSRGRYVIESKDEYKTRTGRGSPDDADSLALANEARYDASGVGSFTGLQNQASRARARRPLAPGLRSGDDQ